MASAIGRVATARSKRGLPELAPSKLKLAARELYDMMLVIADVISAHCPGTTARERFFRASLTEDWEEVRCLVDGMLAEPWHLRGNQEQRLQEFLDLVPVGSSWRTAALSPTNRCSAPAPTEHPPLFSHQYAHVPAWAPTARHFQAEIR